MKRRIVLVILCIVVAFNIFACGSGSNTSATDTTSVNTTQTGTQSQQDTTAPAVVNVSPASNATSVSNVTQITAVFSEAMLSSSITSTTFSVAGVSGTVSYSGLTAIFAPLTPLAYSTTYTARITISVKDLAGNSLASNYTWQFTTGTQSQQDTTAPTVVNVSPTSNASNVFTGTQITAVFSEAMLSSSITSTTFSVAGVSGTVSYSGLTATFIPSAPLAYSTTYTATITDGVKNLAGNSLASNYIWSFTTGAQPPAPANIVLKGSLNPKQDVLGDWNFYGELENIGDRPACFAKITLTFKDSNGALIGSDYTYVAGSPMMISVLSTDTCLGAGEYGGFWVTTALHSLPPSISPAITWDASNITPMTVPTSDIIVDGNIVEGIDYVGYKTLTGIIKNNNSSKTVEFVNISFVGLNGSLVVATDFAYISGAVCGSPTTDTCIAPGQTGTFSVTLLEVPANITSYYYKISYLIL